MAKAGDKIVITKLLYDTLGTRNWAVGPEAAEEYSLTLKADPVPSTGGEAFQVIFEATEDSFRAVYHWNDVQFSLRNPAPVEEKQGLWLLREKLC